MDLAHWVERHAAFAPGKAALRFEGRDLGYADFAARVRRAAARLAALGVAQGDVVAFLGHNHPEMLAVLLACARLRAMLMPLNWRLARPEHARVLDRCPPRVALVDRAFLAHAEGLREGGPELLWVALDDAPAGWRAWERIATADPPPGEPATAAKDMPVLVCFTSGSTGEPKGVVLTQDALFWNAVNSTHMHDLTSADRVLTTLPMFHVGGLNIQTLPALHAGASVTLHAKFEANAALEAIERERITLAVLVPAQLMAMMALPRWETADLSSLRAVTTGSTIVPESFVRAVNRRGLKLIQVYGSTETCPIVAYVRAEDSDRKAGAAGLPALHCEVRVVGRDGTDLPPGTDGEILVRGPNVMRGYWRAPQVTAEALRDGWYHSSDVGHFDDEGYLHVVGRKSDMIISGGENIHPVELESILAECGAIREACVIGVPDPRWGEMVVAVVALRDDAQMSEADVLALFAERVARYKHPRRVRFVDALPRTELGKIKRSALRAVIEPAAA
ncbi:MAG: AMP-binding protein [Xanthobacteraceae bacterium]|nr:AMP-binding protein [Xanthobacteraceae bacterium]